VVAAEDSLRSPSSRSRPDGRARGDGTVASYVNPNARCPERNASVYFYRSPYDGRVFFDDLGPPWPKHWCTDSSRWRPESRRPWHSDHGSLPLRAERTSIVPASGVEPSLREEGWEPLCSSRVSASEGRTMLTGDLRSKFTELLLFDVAKFDRDGPVFTRTHEQAPGFHVVAVLQSDYTGTRERYHFACDMRLAPLGTEILSRALNDQDAVTLAEVGRFMLYEVEDLPSAITYLERACAGGATEVAADLAVALLFSTGER
jgi:hypothetical protein